MPKPKATITVQCVYNKKHTQVVDAATTKDFPLCSIDGGPMIAVSAKIRRAR